MDYVCSAVLLLLMYLWHSMNIDKSPMEVFGLHTQRQDGGQHYFTVVNMPLKSLYDEPRGWSTPHWYPNPGSATGVSLQCTHSIFYFRKGTSRRPTLQCPAGGGGGRGFNPPQSFFFACQYMKIPVDLPPPPNNSGPEPPPPLEEFLDPPLLCVPDVNCHKSRELQVSGNHVVVPPNNNSSLICHRMHKTRKLWK